MASAMLLVRMKSALLLVRMKSAVRIVRMASAMRVEGFFFFLRQIRSDKTVTGSRL